MRITGMFYFTMKSPVGPLLLVGDERGLRQVHFANGRRPKSPARDWTEDKAPFREAMRRARDLLRGKVAGVRFAAGPRRHGVSETGVEQSAKNSLRRNGELRTIGAADREPRSGARGGACERLESHTDYYSVPPGDREQRKFDGIWRRTSGEEKAAGTGARATELSLTASRHTGFAADLTLLCPCQRGVIEGRTAERNDGA